MKRFQISLAWLSSSFLLSANIASEGCSTKESPGAPVVQQSPADTPAAQQASVTVPAQNPPTQNNAPPPADQASQMQLPEVNLAPAGLDELLAPIALYPDPVVAVMLQASVNPQEVMDGGNWLALDQNQNLKDAALDQASQKAGFTPVMQALLHYPTVVDMMCVQFDWTKQLGAAYQADPRAVLDSVQRLRAQAVDTGALKSSPQMKVESTQSNGQQVIACKPADPKVVYIPQYNPDQVFQTTTTTRPDGTVTTTTSGPAPAASTSTNTTVVQQQSSGVSTGTAVMIGLLTFGAGIAVGAAINNNNYYYPAWGYGGVWYGPRPYYPPPYRPVYYGGWHGGYYYNRPVHYSNTSIYINNNYYNRFNHNNNLRPGYQPRPVPYNRNPNSTYSRNMGSRPASNQGVHYKPPANNGNVSNRPVNPGGGNVANTPAQRPAPGNNANNWKGQTTYQGNKNLNNRPVNAATPQPSRNPSGDRGFAQNGGVRPSTGNTYNRPSTGNTPYNRPSNSTAGTPNARPAVPNQPASRPAPMPANQPSAAATQLQNRQQQPSGAFAGANNAKADRAASNRGHASMGASAGRQAAIGARKR